MSSPDTSLLAAAQMSQATARQLLDLCDQGITSGPDFAAAMARWIAERSTVIEAEIASPLDGLIMVHALRQCAVSLVGAYDQDDRMALEVLAYELSTAAEGLIRYFETASGYGRADLGLHDDYRGPARN
jgi:hypothetical protein